MKAALWITLVLLLCSQPSAGAKRGLWVWYSNTVVSSNAEVNKLINQCKNDNITDVYLWANGMLSGASKTRVQAFIAKASCNNIRVWAMDGYRGYFSDWLGPTGFYNFINSVITYNSTSAPDERFVGIHADNEPHDGQSEPNSSFHNDVTDSDLSTAGGGVWQATEALDREYLMRDWLTITETAYNTCVANNLLLGHAVPSWLDDYYGEPVYCTYDGVRQEVYKHLMNYLHDYCIMSYRTNPAQLVARVTGELAYAATLPAAIRPDVWAGVETHCGVGNGVSYCDTPGKNSKSAVWTDIATAEATLNTYSSYTGMNIHDWIDGWRDLPSVSNNTNDPGCPLPVEFLSIEGKNIETYNLINWVTAWESDNKEFEIEKSEDGIHFEAFDRIAGSLNSQEKKVYEVKDYSPFSEITFYRIRQIDLDGNFSYSPVIAVLSSNQSFLQVYPNPASGSVNIIRSNEGEVQVEVYSADGKLCLSAVHVSSRILLDISFLRSGMYKVLITDLISGKMDQETLVVN